MNFRRRRPYNLLSTNHHYTTKHLLFNLFNYHIKYQIYSYFSVSNNEKQWRELASDIGSFHVLD